MNTKLLTNRKLKRMFVNILSIVVILAMAFPVTGAASAQEPVPWLIAFPERDFVESYEWPMGTLVHLMIDDPATEDSPDLQSDDTAELSPWAPWGDPRTYVSYEFAGEYNLKPGDVVTLTDGFGTTRTYTVQTLSVIEVNADADTVSGTAELNAVVQVWPHGTDYFIEDTAEDGTWFANFGALGFHAIEETGGRSQIVIGGNATAVDWSAPPPPPGPWLRAHPEWESVDGWYWPLGATLHLTIDDPNTDMSPDLEMQKLVDVVTAPPENNTVWFDFAGRYDLKPGDLVTMSDGTTTRHLELSNVAITGIDLEANIVKGMADPGTEIRLPIPTELFVTAEANGNWEANFGEADLVRDMTVIAEVYDRDDDPGDGTSFEHYVSLYDGEHWGTEGIAHPNSCNASGWAEDLDDLTREVTIRIQTNDEIIAEGATKGHGFYFNLWGLISNYEEHQITSQAYDVETETWANLGGTPKALTCTNYDLFIFDTKTGKAERLTPNLPNTGEYNPSWSNNGKQIVHDVADANSHALYITNVKTKVSSPLSGGDGGNDASWSPNGMWIVFDRRWTDNDTNLYLLPPSGGTRQMVVSNATNGDWSPDSLRLVFERDGGLWTASVKDGNAQQIVEAGYGPAWSPDGLWIAYDLDGDIWKIAVDEFGVRAGDPIQLTSGPVSEGGTTWSQNGEFIVFASDATGDHDIWQIAAEGGVPTQLRGVIGYGDYDPDYSNNGQYIAYEGAMEPSVPHVESDTWLNTYALADWPVGQIINVSIDDPGTSKQPDYRTTFTPDGTSNWYLFQPGLDIEPGFVITAKSKFFTKTLFVSNLAATDIDAANGIVHGVATPNNSFYMVADGDHFRLPSGQGVSVDENGNWIADFSGAEAPRPWTWYTGGEMFEWDVDGDMTHAFWHLHQEVIEVWLPYNEIRAFDWPLNTNLKFYVDGEEIATALTEPTVWMNGTWAVVNTGELQLQLGMIVTVTDGVTTKAMVIQDVKITKIDADNDLVYGYGPTDITLELGSWEDSPVFRFFNADEDGNWRIDYSIPSINGVTVDLNPGDDIRLFARDAEKDATVWEAITYPPLYLRVNYGHDWVESFYEGGHTTWITVTDADGNVKATAELVTEPKDFWGGETGFQTAPENWDPAPPDIQPYDWVYGWVDNGASAQVQIGDISGMINLADDFIEGTINAPWFSNQLEVDCHSWGAPLPEEILKSDTVLPNGEDTYTCSWSGEWDIQPGQTVGVGYSGSDGNWVANAFDAPNPNLYALPDENKIFAQEWIAGFNLELTIYNSLGEVLQTDTKMVEPPSVVPWTVVIFEGFDIEPGQRILLSQRGYERELIVSSLMITGFDLDNQRVIGTGDPGARIFIRINGEDIWGDVNNEGNWTISHPQLTPGVWGEAIQPDGIDGDETRDGFRAPNPMMIAWKNWDIVAGYEWTPEVEVTVTIDDPSNGQGVDYTYAQVAAESGNSYYGEVHFNLGIELQTGYVLTMTDGNFTKKLIISALTVTGYNFDNHIIYGTGDPGTQLLVHLGGITSDLTTVGNDHNWSVYHELLEPGVWFDAIQTDEDGDQTRDGGQAY